MPILVDHAERRRHVIDVASRILAKSGLNAVTVRDVARAANYSTAVVSHYFKNKDELLTLVFRQNVIGVSAKTDAVLVESGGDLKAFLECMLALDAERVDNWRIWHAYVAHLAYHPEVATLHKESAAERIDQITTILESMRAKRLLRPRLNTRNAAARLVFMLVGLAIQVLFDPENWPPERQHAVLDDELRAILK